MTINRGGDCCQNKELFFRNAGYEKEKLFHLFKAIVDYYKKLLPNESFFKIVFLKVQILKRICTLAIV